MLQILSDCDFIIFSDKRNLLRAKFSITYLYKQEIMNNQTNATNATSPPPPGLPPADNHELIQISITCPFVIIGLVGNLLVIAVIVSKRTIKKATNNDIYLLNLAIADFLYICFNTANFIFNLHYFAPHTKSLLFCKIPFPMLSVPFCAGVFNIAAMSIYRCWVIMNPFSPKTRSLWIHFCALMTWVFSCLVFLPFTILSVNHGPQCVFPTWSLLDKRIYFSTVTFIQYPLPLLIIFCAYFKIGLYLRKPRVPQLSFVARGKTLVSPRDETRKESIAMTKTVGAIVLLFAVLMLPLQIAMQAVTSFDMYEEWVLELWSYGDRLAMIHSALNPFLYTIRTPQYRQQIMAWLKGKPLNKHNFTCQKSRCQSLSASCATTEFDLNEKREEDTIKLDQLNGNDAKL